jgi:hypothetical protein
MLPSVLARAAIALGFAAGVVTVVLVAGTPALAGKPNYDPRTISGPLINVGDEPRAAGGWTETIWSAIFDPRDPYYRIHFQELTISCTKLTPGATYVLYAATSDGEGEWGFVAQANGKGGIRTGFSAYGYANPFSYFPLLLEVYRVDGDNRVLVLAYSHP